MTIGDVCTTALEKLGVVAAGETPSAEDMEKALKSFNSISDGWRTMRLFTFALVRTTWTITANDGSYTLGSAGDVVLARPVFVDKIAVIDTSLDPDHEIDLGPLLTDAEYQAITAKALTSTYPQRVHYNATYPAGTITFWPVPTSSTLSGVIYTPNATGTYAQSDTLSVPPGYQSFYENNLAVELAPDFEREPSQALLRAAARAEDRLKMVNVRPLVFSCDPALVGRAFYDIETG